MMVELSEPGLPFKFPVVTFNNAVVIIEHFLAPSTPHRAALPALSIVLPILQSPTDRDATCTLCNG